MAAEELTMDTAADIRCGRGCSARNIRDKWRPDGHLRLPMHKPSKAPWLLSSDARGGEAIDLDAEFGAGIAEGIEQILAVRSDHSAAGMSMVTNFWPEVSAISSSL